MNRRIAAGIGVLVVLVVAIVLVLTLGGGDGESATASTTTQPPSTAATTIILTTTTAVATTTTQPAQPTTEIVTTTTADPDAPPYPNTADLDDPEEIWREIVAYHNWIFQHPDQAEVWRYLDPRCSCYDFVQDLIDEYATNGWHESRDSMLFDHLDVNIASSQGYVLDVFDHQGAYDIIDEDGSVVSVHEAEPLSWWTVTLVRGDDGGFLVREWTFVQEMGG